MAGGVGGGVVEGEKGSRLCEPGDPNSNLGVDGDNGWSGTASLGMVRGPGADVGGVETGEEGRRFGSGRPQVHSGMENPILDIPSGPTPAIKRTGDERSMTAPPLTLSDL